MQCNEGKRKNSGTQDEPTQNHAVYYSIVKISTSRAGRVGGEKRIVAPTTPQIKNIKILHGCIIFLFFLNKTQGWGVQESKPLFFFFQSYKKQEVFFFFLKNDNPQPLPQGIFDSWGQGACNNNHTTGGGRYSFAEEGCFFPRVF